MLQTSNFSDINTPIVVPRFKTWQQAMITLYHFMEGRKTTDRFVDWLKMIDAMHERYKFSAFHAASELRDDFDPPVLQFRKGKPEEDKHRLDERFFRDPRGLFKAINDAERVEGIKEKDWAKIPDITETAGLLLAQSGAQAPSAPALKIGDIVPMEGGGHGRITEENGEIVVKPLRIVQAPPARQATESELNTPTEPLGSLREHARQGPATNGTHPDPVPKGGTAIQDAIDALARMSYQDLRDTAKEYKIKGDGTKDELRERITAHLRAAAAPPAKLKGHDPS